MQLQDSRQLNNGSPFAVKMYSTVVALLPVLATYASGIPGFSVADVVLAMCCVMTVLGTRYKKNEFAVRPTRIIVALYLIILFDMLTAVIQPKPQYGNIAIRTIRYFFYLTVISLCSQRLLDLNLCKKIVRKFAVFSGVFILLQFILYRFFGKIVMGYLPFLNLYVEGYAQTDYATLYKAIYRPTSLFLEPAHFSRYAILGIILFLFDRDRLSWKDTLCAVFISLGILISTSAQGYVLLALVWLVCLMTRTKTAESNSLRNFLYVAGALLPLILLLILEMPFVKDTVARAMNIDTNQFSNENTAIGARLGGFSAYFNLSPLYKLIGMGFGVVPKGVWLSSAAYWLYGSGCIVFVLYLLYGAECLFRIRGASRMILLIFLILFFSDDSFYSYMCVLFVSLSCLKPVEEIRR